MQEDILFDARFMGRYAGAIISDRATALVELVANAWDAYATSVEIVWPDKESNRLFRIVDNGIGMSPEEFGARWGTVDYNRTTKQGQVVQAPADLKDFPPRHAYGRNGRGRHAAFSFSTPDYHVRTWKDGTEATFRVWLAGDRPFRWELLDRKTGVAGHGTEIIATSFNTVNMSADRAREVLGTRFLVDPNFKVTVDGDLVTFDDVPSDLLTESEVDVPGLGKARVVMIDTPKADRSTRQHGIGWRVHGRLVGDVGWRTSDYLRVIDGRSSEAKRFTVIVFADFLADAVKADWSDFDPAADEWRRTQPIVQDHIKSRFRALSASQRLQAKETIRSRHEHTVAALAPVSRERWNTFVDKVVEDCPTISVDDVDQIAGILANLEFSRSKYGLLSKLHALAPDDLDAWHDILGDWTVATAKVALDEIQTRLKVIEEMDVKLRDESSDEVQELQPLFDRSLWVFGPEFESIEFTSNRGMSEVIRKLLGGTVAGTRQRPDFVIVPEGSTGFYARDRYGADHEAHGVSNLVIVEIKRPGIPIGSEQKGQAWRYVKELLEKGLIDRSTTVNCFVLGSKVDQTETGDRTEMNGTVIIKPMSYDAFIRRAERRMLNLRSKLSDAPFLQEQNIDTVEFLTEPMASQPMLRGIAP